VTQEKVESLADQFLVPGSDNDIYDWVTTILGEPWGAHTFENLLSVTDYGQTIDILLVDILRDGNTESGVVGFFWGKDNYYRTSGTGSYTDQSNQRVMFYLDAPMYGQLEDGSWSEDQFWPQLIFSTLAHEFQHMIHFYQKNVLRTGTDSQRWLNELASMVIEDLVSYQMEVPGPRGVDPMLYPAGTAGPTGIVDGWLGHFNAYNDTGIYEWDFDDPQANYAVNYGFGSFLARNHGGAPFIRALVHNDFVDELAIEAAFEAVGDRTTLREALSEWAAAVLTSDERIVPWEGGDLDSVYNAGQWFESTVDSITYRLGSINLYNHVSGSGVSAVEGPQVYSGDDLGNGDTQEAASVVYYQAGSSATGKLEWEISLGANTDLVVVAKAAE
jgi:hypothetical protein